MTGWDRWKQLDRIVLTLAILAALVIAVLTWADWQAGRHVDGIVCGAPERTC